MGVQAAIETLEVEEGGAAVAQSPVTLELRRETGCTVIAAVRGGQAYHAPDPNFRFEIGDLVVVVGTPEAIGKAAAIFRKPVERTKRSGQLRMTGRFRVSGSVMFYPEGDTVELDAHALQEQLKKHEEMKKLEEREG